MQCDDPRPPSDPAAALRLAETIAARLCHDFSSPIGALGNALEIIGEPDLAGEAKSIADAASASLTARLRLVRAAWCATATPLDADAVAGLTGDLAAGRIATDLVGLDRGPFPPPLARILLNMMMLGAESLPAGGTVALAGNPADGIVLSIAGARAAWPPSLPTLLADEAAAWAAIGDPRQLQLPLTALLVRAGGCRLAPLLGSPSAVPPLLLTALR